MIQNPELNVISKKVITELELKEKSDKMKLYKKKWMLDNMEKMALASRKYYESKKNDPEFIEKRRIRNRESRDKLNALIGKEKIDKLEEPEIKELKTRGRPRKYL